MCEEFCDAIGTARVKVGHFILERRPHLSEHFRTRGLIEPDALVDDPDRFKQVEDSDASNFSGSYGLLERRADETLRRKVIKLLRLVLLQQPNACAQVRQIVFNESEARVGLDIQLGESPEIWRTHPT